MEILGGPGVGCDEPLRDRYARTTARRGTRPLAVLFPETTEQVRRIVAEANRQRVALHPISRGRNWGYGDACPPSEGQIIVDLGRMNRILEVNTRLGYAVIEPGVTQGQLHQHLRDNQIPLWMDATGAGLEASFVGNTLDRGFGHTRYGDHFLSACGMEVVLGDGRVLHTGLGHYPNAVAHRVYPYGVGPSLDGLFAQSSFGIVTRIGLWLMPEPEAFSAFFFFTEDDAALPDIIERLAPLRMQGLLQSTIHVANDLRVLSARIRYPWERAGGATPLPDELRRALREEHGVGAWSGCGGIYGTAETVAAAKKAVRRALHGYPLAFVDDRRLARAERLRAALGRIGFGKRLDERLETIKPVYGLLKGEPTDEPLRGAAWRVRPDAAGGPEPVEGAASEAGAAAPDETAPPPRDPLDCHAGLMWASPILPMTGESAADLLAILEPIYLRHGFEPLITFTLITERAMVCVTNLAFDRRETLEAERAAKCYDELSETLIDRGYIPYRTGPDGYAKLARGSTGFWDIVADLKRTLDPNHIISPGRYQP